MIEKAVFSYYNSFDNFQDTAGFSSFQDFLFVTGLAVDCAYKSFGQVQMITTRWGEELFKALEFPVSEYSNVLDEIKDIPRHFWAYGKIVAYAIQDKPFLHIDNDVFIWKPLPKRFLEGELCFQSREPFNSEWYSYYNLLRQPWEIAPVKPKKIADNPVYYYAYNCGVCGGHNLDFFRQWKECAKEYITAPENQRVFFYEFPEVVIRQNLWFEQYFAASLVKAFDLRDKVRVLAINAQDIEKRIKYTHLWGETKRDWRYCTMARLNLKLNNFELHKRIESFCKKNNI